MKMEERLRNERRLGREEGLMEGEKNGKRKLICDLLLSGAIDMSTAVIASELSEEEIQDCLERMNKADRS